MTMSLPLGGYFPLLSILISSRLAAPAASAAGAPADGDRMHRRLRARDAMRELQVLIDEGSMSLSLPYEDPEGGDDGGGPSFPLAGTSWRAAEIPSLPAAAANDKPVTLSFDGDGEQARGSAGCNWYFGSVAHHPLSSKFSVGGLATTRMHCAGAMDREGAYLSLLDGGTFRFEVTQWDGGTTAEELVLYDDGPQGGGDVVARFVQGGGDGHTTGRGPL